MANSKITQIKLTDTAYDIDVASNLKATKIIGEDPAKIASVEAIQKPDGTHNLFDENNKINSHYISDTILGNHTHTITLEDTSDTADINLGYNSKYKLKVGNTDIVFKMPTDNDDLEWGTF